jgi:Ca-activated chloride channel family protein
MSNYTSFVAVEKKVVNIGGKQRTVEVPVEMVDGVSYEGVFGSNLGHGAAVNRSRAFAVGKSAGRSAGGVANLAISAPEKDELALPSSLEANGQKIVDSTKVNNYVRKVSKKLYKAVGSIEIQLLVKDIDGDSLEKLTAKGLKVYTTDKGLKIVFGKCDAKALIDLAQLEFVKLISPL